MPNYIRVKQINQGELTGFFVDSISSESGLLLAFASGAAYGVASGIILNETVLLTGNQIISGVKTFTTGIFAPNLVYNTGNQTISGVKTFTTGIFAPNLVYNTGNQTISGVKTFTTGIFAPNLVYNTGNQTISGVKTFAAAGNNIVISGTSDAEGLIKSLNSNLTIEGANSTYGIYFADDGTYIRGNTEINNDLLAQTGTFQKLYADNLVYNTGNQNISGIKNFTNNLVIQDNILFSSQPSGFFSGVGITGSGDGGFFLGRNKISQNTLLLKDENIGNSFSTKLIDSIRNWRGIAMSSDGKYQTAVNNAGYIYISNDYGNTWREKDSSRTWVDVSMSSCGKYQTAITNSSPFGNIYVSSDYGNTWILAASSIISPQRIAMSSDGKIQVLAKYTPTQEYVISNDYGNTWTAGDVSSASGVRAVAISSDGKYITLVGSGTPDRIYISSDYGSTWTTVGPSSIGFSAVAMSSNGQYQVASASSGYIYISSDYGNNWALETSSGSRSWLSVDINSDGKYIVAGAASGNIYISSNYGETWKSIATSQVWYSIKISSNGKYIIAAAGANYIYISKTDEQIDGNLYAENLVYNTGNQTISGVKNFSSTPTVNGTGVLLSGDSLVTHIRPSGTNNVFVSSGALASTSIGSQNNIAVGVNALTANAVGDDNVAMGHEALYSNTNGNGNIGIGRDALKNANGPDANICIGTQAGDTIQAGGSNIIIGHEADVDNGGRQRCIVLGRSAVSPAIDGSLAIGGTAGNVMANLTGTSAGAAAGDYLNIYINGVQRKIALLLP